MLPVLPRSGVELVHVDLGPLGLQDAGELLGIGFELRRFVGVAEED